MKKRERKKARPKGFIGLLQGLGGLFGAKGGLVPSYGAGGMLGHTPTGPILYEGGEYVMNADAVAKHGVGFMDQLNSYAGGGEIRKVQLHEMPQPCSQWVAPLLVKTTQ